MLKESHHTAHFLHSYIALFLISLFQTLSNSFSPLHFALWIRLPASQPVCLVSRTPAATRIVTSWWSTRMLTPFQLSWAMWFLLAHGKCHFQAEAFNSWCSIPRLFPPLPQPQRRSRAPRRTSCQSLCQPGSLGNYVEQSFPAGPWWTSSLSKKEPVLCYVY